MKRIAFAFFLAATLILAPALVAQPDTARLDSEAPPVPGVLSKSHFGSSPFNPPDENDTTFVVDQAGGLDTGCTFRSGGPLVFEIEVDRVVGDVAKLKQNGLISEKAVLQMPAFDVDFDAVVPPFNPERDRVFFNGNVVPGEFLTGSNGIWKQNTFNIPIEWVNFAADPGAGGQAMPVANTIRIDIDIANTDEVWCTAIDWASLQFEAVRPTIMAHGILSNGGIWNNVWVPQLNSVGILTDNDLNMGALDSIGNNAGKIGAVADRAMDRWGVDRVNIVCHSKGGLDARHYAESNDSIDQLVQLGTPNAGSPLADAAQGGAVILTGLGGTALINLIAGPAGIQLTQPYMAIYNAAHGSNPKVQYTALAGNYDPDCFFLNPFCRPLERLLLAITGPGDTIVPITSAHALGYTQNRLFQSRGGNKEATHSGLHGSQAVYNGTSDRVRRFGRPKMSSPEYARTATVGGEIAAGDTFTHPVPIDQASPTFFSLMYPAGDVELVLITPSGLRIDPAAAAGDPEIEFDAGEILGGRMLVYSLGDPEVGVWTAEVSAIALDDPMVGYAVNAWIESPAVTFVGSLGSDAVPTGTSLDLFGTLYENGAPLTGATVAAQVVLPDDTTIGVAFSDDGTGADVTAGDGIYSGRLSATTQPGYYRIGFTASGLSSSSALFSREDFGLAAVSASSSTLNAFRDFGRDTDGDGFFNELVVEVDLSITAATDYRVFGVLTDTAGNTHEAFVTGSFAVGPATAELSFDGEAIFQNRVDGPYTLSRVQLVEEDDFLILPVAEDSDAHLTAAYAYGEFQHGPIELTGQGSAVGVDTDGNGLFNLLNVGVEVELERAGFYQWSAQLVDGDGTELDFDARSAFFGAGFNSLSFVFDGTAIGENGIDGPYFVTSLLLFGAGADLVANNAFETPAFLASQFEGFVFDTTPPTLEVTVDPALLWPPNHRLVEITATVTAIDDVDPDPAVRLVSIVSSEDDNGLGDGNTSDDVQGADFGSDDRLFLLRAERSGKGVGRTYTITYAAEDAAGNVAEATAIVTVPHDFKK